MHPPSGSTQCPEHFIAVPEKFRKQDDIRDDSYFGRFLIREMTPRVLPMYSDMHTQILGMNKLQVLEDILLRPDIDLEQLMKSFKTMHESSVRGNLYESFWDIVVKLDQLPTFSTQNGYMHIISKVEDGGVLNPTPMTHVYTYLKESKVMTGNKAGISDITLKEVGQNANIQWACVRRFQDTETDNYVVSSVKYFTKERSIESYNIQELVTVMESTGRRVKNLRYKLLLFVRNKAELEHILSRSRSYKQYFEKDVTAIYDLEDLVEIVQKMRKNASAIRETLEAKRKRTQLPLMEGRFHQLLFVNKTLNRIHGWHGEKKVRRFLWGQVARSGKTYTAGLLISKLKRLGNSYLNDVHRLQGRHPVIMVITPAPGETIDQFKKDVFDSYRDFEDFDVLQYDARLKPSALKIQRPTILVCSKQFLQGTKDTNGDLENTIGLDDSAKTSLAQKCKPLQNKIDLILFDEIHYGGTTDISRAILDMIDPLQRAVWVFLTATYKKPVQTYDIDVQSELMTWGLEDIQTAKYISSPDARSELYQQYGKDYVDEVIAELLRLHGKTHAEVYDMIERDYQKYPTMHVLTSQFDDEKVQDIRRDNPNAYGFDINALFELSAGKQRFLNEASLQNILNYIGDMENPRSLYRRMNAILSDYGQKRPFTSQLWFLPFFVGNKIKPIASATHALIEAHPHFKDYMVIDIVDTKHNKDTVKKAELEALRGPGGPKKGLIILVGKKFSLGVSLPCVDAVFFMNNDTEVDVIYQRMFRSLTESEGKKIGFVVDMNPYRTISAVMEYGVKKVSQTASTKETEYQQIVTLIKNKTIFIDEDLIRGTTKNAPTFTDLYKSVKNMIYENFANKQIIEIGNSLESNLLTQFMRYGDEADILGMFDITKNNTRRASRMTILSAQRMLALGRQKEDNQSPIQSKLSDTPNTVLDTAKENACMNMMMVWKDIIFLLAILLRNESRDLGHKSFEELLRLAYEKNKNTNECEEDQDEDEISIDVVFKIMYQKVQPLLKLTHGMHPCHAFIKFLGTCIHHVFGKNNMFQEYNSDFARMKHGMANIDDKDMNKLYRLVEEHLPPKTFEKKQFGEVFTPLELVKEMLDAIDKYADKDFWKNPNLKILDPAAGIGNFPIIAFEKLNEGLKDKIPNATKRKKHILEKMLYMVELNGNNVRMMKKILNADHYKLNIIRGDFLSEKTQRRLFDLVGEKECKFDLVMGNPPFQKAANRDVVTGSDKLWQSFVEISLNLMTTNGFMTFIHPQNWRKVLTDTSKKSEIYKKMRERQIHYLVMRNEKHSKQIFNVSTNFDYYLLQNIYPNTATIILDELDATYKVRIDKLPFIPSYGLKNICKLLSSVPDDRTNFIYSSSAFESRKQHVKMTKSTEFCYPLVHVIKSSNIVLLWTNKKYKDALGSNMFGVKKVILTKSSGNGLDDVIIDIDGEYGLTQNTFAIEIANKEEGKELKNFLLSNEFTNILKATKGAGIFIDYNIFRFFRKDFWTSRKMSNEYCNDIK